VKGSVLRGTIYNAYNKTSLGSIPAKFENILKPIIPIARPFYNNDYSN